MKRALSSSVAILLLLCFIFPAFAGSQNVLDQVKPNKEGIYLLGSGKSMLGVVLYRTLNDSSSHTIVAILTDKTIISEALVESGLVEGFTSDNKFFIRSVAGYEENYKNNEFWHLDYPFEGSTYDHYLELVVNPPNLALMKIEEYPVISLSLVNLD